MTIVTADKPQMGGRWKFVLTRDFIRQLHALGSEAFGKWRRVGGSFFADPFGSRVKPELIVPDQRIYSARLDAHYRLLFCLRDPNQIILCWLDEHDAAYAMARRLAVSLDDNAVAVVTIQHERPLTKPQPAVYDSTRAAGRLFNAWSDAELRACGASDEWISQLRQLDSIGELLAYEGAIPGDTFDRLLKLISPQSPPMLFTPIPPAAALEGRSDERKALENLLLEPTSAMVCLVGSSGIGKTALAAWAAKQSEELGYGVHWLACRERKSSTVDAWLRAVAIEGPDSIMSVLCSRSEPLDERLQAALELLRGAPSFLVFDDYDTLENREAFDVLILAAQRYASTVKLLLTSREMPGVSTNLDLPSGFVVIRQLQALDLASFNSIIEVSDLAASLTPQDRQVIWRKTYGNPGVLRRNQKWIRQQTWRESLESLDLEHEGWLRDILSSSALEAAERLAIAGPRLSIRLARELLTDLDDTVILGELVDKEVLRNPEPGMVVLDNASQTWLLSGLDRDKKHALHRAIAETSGRLAQQTGNSVSKKDLLLLALHHYDQAGDGEADILTLSAPTYDLLLVLSDWEQARQVAERAVRAAEAGRDPFAQVNWAVVLAGHQIDREELVAAVNVLESALSLIPTVETETYQTQPDKWTRTRARLSNQLGRLAYRQQNYDKAQAILLDVPAMARVSGDMDLEVEAMIRLGQIERRRGRFDVATQWLQKALQLAANLSNKALEFECHTGLGALARKDGNPTAANHHYLSAHRLALATGDPLLTEVSLSQLGRLAQIMGDSAMAEVFIRDALGRAETMHNQRGKRIELTRLIDLLLAQEKFDEAEALLAEAEQRNHLASDLIGQAWNLKQRGQLAIALGNIDAGNRLVRAGIEELRKMGNQEYMTEFKAVLTS